MESPESGLEFGELAAMGFEHAGVVGDLGL
jgi:hypothetical protein